MRSDNYYIDLVLSLALKAKGSVSPNPLVGAIIVKNNKIIGQGYHKKAGFDHAEIAALNQAGVKAKNATLYVNLEPCSHFGRTPPCVNKIIDAGIKKIVIGMIDPNPLNNGRGVNILKKAGIKVRTGIREKEAKNINQPFIKYITKQLPYITVKVGQSLDGKIAAKSFDSEWITSKKSRDYARKLRDDFDAVILGTNTVLQDNPKFKTKKAIRIIIDKDLKISKNLNIFKHKKTKIIIAALRKNISRQYPENTEVLVIKERNNQLSLVDLMKKLAKKEIANVLVEGGGELIGSLFDEKLVDEIKFFIAPKIIGGRGAISSVMGEGIEKIGLAPEIRDLKIKNIDKDFLVEARVVYGDN